MSEDFEDQVKAGKNSENSIILLNTILSNLEAAISSKDPKLKTDDSKIKIKKIKNNVEALQCPKGKQERGGLTKLDGVGPVDIRPSTD